ncbi:MAG TPA: NAD-dependent epimerase/dehydratase family protein [Balneolales bacterium]|nr:NAD-dependent epimerase/dehydratase family protein [Balneolales bacterium]
MKRVLVSGGAGYIGSVLVRLLLNEGYYVRVIDNLNFGGESIIELMNLKNFEFQKGDIRKEKDLEWALEGMDIAVHLAGIVGDPACAKDSDLAESTNYEGSILFYRLANQMGIERFVFASTCSNYGKMDHAHTYVAENSRLAPVSLYAQTKVATELYLLGQPVNNVCKPSILRFSTVYGLSPRPRFDLTVNEFTKELAMGRELVVFGEQFWRPYCHVVDLSRAVLLAIESPIEKVAFEVFNVGDTHENYQKKTIVKEILKIIPNGNVRYVKKNEDPRDYRVSFEKIKEKLGFKISMKLPDGINQLNHVLSKGFFRNPDDMRYRNV